MTSSRDGKLAEELPLLGDEEADRQHRVLLECWRTLQRALGLGDRGAVHGNLWFLERYSAEHFAAEERIMAGVAYPALDRHRRRHALFLRQLRRARAEVSSQGPLRAGDDFRWILEWVLLHVPSEDARLARFLEGRRAG